MAATSSTSSSPRTVASIISSYYVDGSSTSSDTSDTLKRIAQSISEVLEENLPTTSPDRFVDWLLNEKIIDFRPPFSGPRAGALFAKHIYPLLVESASEPDERAHLYKIAKDAQSAGHFIAVIPKFGKTSHPKGGSFAARAHQGVPISSYCEALLAKGVTESDLMTARAMVDSYVIEYLLDNKSIERMVSKSGEWHIGTTSLRSGLIHEFTHIGDFLSGAPSEKAVSCRWTNDDEERTIKRENVFAATRGEMQRVSHNHPSYESTYKQQSAHLRLFDAWMLAADGTVRELCEHSSMASAESPDRIEFNTENLNLCAIGYLASFPSKEQLKSDIDRAYWEEIVIHKNKALQFSVTQLLKWQGVDAVQAFLKTILESAPTAGRDDAIPFIKELMRIALVDKGDAIVD